MQSMNNIPFPPEKQTKVAYVRILNARQRIWMRGAAVPAPYPLKDFDLINKLGIVANEDNFYLSFGTDLLSMVCARAACWFNGSY